MPVIASPVDGTRLRYDASGSGPVLVLLHGSVLSRAIWRGLGYLDLLTQQRTVVRVDVRGHGSSGAPHDPAVYTQDVLVADLLAVFDAVGADQADLMGYSLGARIAVTAAVRHPQRVRHVVSLGGSPADQRGAIETVFFPGVLDVLRSEGMAGFCARQGLGPEVKDRQARTTRHAFLAADPLAMAALFEATEATPAISEEQLAACTVPTLWIAGSKDQPRADQSRRAAELMPHGRYIELPGRTHGTTLAPAGPVLRTALPFLLSGRVR